MGLAGAAAPPNRPPEAAVVVAGADPKLNPPPPPAGAAPPPKEKLMLRFSLKFRRINNSNVGLKISIVYKQRYFVTGILIAAGHDASYTLDVNILRDVSRLDDLLLVTHGHKSSVRCLPAILLHPELHSILLDKPQQLAHHLVLDGLVGDADHVTHKPSDAVLEPGHGLDEVSLAVDLLPKDFELTHLQQVGKVQDIGDLQNSIS